MRKEKIKLLVFARLSVWKTMRILQNSKENSRTNVSSVRSQYTRPTHKINLIYCINNNYVKRKKIKP